jgi:hypothetical protein
VKFFKRGGYFLPYVYPGVSNKYLIFEEYILFPILADQLWKIDGRILKNNGNPSNKQTADDKWIYHPSSGYLEKDPQKVDEILYGKLIKSKCS